MVTDPSNIRLIFSWDSKLLSLVTYWNKWSYNFDIARMDVNLDEMDRNGFSWELMGDSFSLS
jgi:hypothetical protein